MSILKSAGPIHYFETVEGRSCYSLPVQLNCTLGPRERIAYVTANGSQLTIEQTLPFGEAAVLLIGPYPAGFIPRVDDELVVIIETKWPPVLTAAVTQTSDQSVTVLSEGTSSVSASDVLEALASTDSPTPPPVSSPKRKTKKSKHS